MRLDRDRRLVGNPSSAGWPWIEGRRDIPGVVQMVRAGGRPMLLGPETVGEVCAWIERVGWEPDAAPVLLVDP